MEYKILDLLYNIGGKFEIFKELNTYILPMKIALNLFGLTYRPYD